MSNKAIYTAAAPSAIGPYSQGISAREYAFISGQLPIDPATGAFPSEDIAAQTRQSLLNLKAIIEANGMTMADVVKTTVLLADINEFGEMCIRDSRYCTQQRPPAAGEPPCAGRKRQISNRF